MLKVLNMSRSGIPPGTGDQVEHRQHAHGAARNARTETVGDAAGDILIEAAARDVGHTLHAHGVKEGEHGLYIDLRRGEQRLAETPAAELRAGAPEIGVLDVKDLAHEGKAIGVDAARGQRDHDIAGAHGRLIEDLRLVDDAHGKAARSYSSAG